jgi:hypothetical protein
VHIVCTSARGRRLDELHDYARRALDRILDRFSLVGSQRSKHVIRHVITRRWATDADAQPTKVAGAEARDDVAQAVVAAVAAALAFADLANAEVEVVVHDQQPRGSWPPALDRFHHDLAAVVHVTAGQDQPRAAHRDRNEAGCHAQAEELGCPSHRARSKVVARPRVLSLGVPQPDSNSRRGVARGESISSRHLALIMTNARELAAPTLLEGKFGEPDATPAATVTCLRRLLGPSR